MKNLRHRTFLKQSENNMQKGANYVILTQMVGKKMVKNLLRNVLFFLFFFSWVRLIPHFFFVFYLTFIYLSFRKTKITMGNNGGENLSIRRNEEG